MFLTLLKVELLKTKRTLALLIMFACPLMVVTLLGLMSFNQEQVIDESFSWQHFWFSTTAIWGYFMLPLYIALVTALLNQTEHKVAGWRFMHALPLSAVNLFWAKATLAWLYLMGACLALYVFTLGMSGLLVAFKGWPSAGLFDFPYWQNMLKTAVAALPILLIQHIVSWRFANIVAPLALGVIATMGIMQVSSSKEHWFYYPWSYVLVANNNQNPETIGTALTLSAVLAVVLMLVGSVWAHKRQVLA
ncbi:hypothetical protein DRW07_16105 [Alteromonas sediminis]|uniref:ABC transporter permease n=1 Tax=Alteromonas sediminis TaxID=2259342 RepID=A0A3N5Y9R3_9ALTE|nr:ABC transporter permease [Alteromonas sediminis]RPJ65425.1 hypothetical protein DRW07_16105 [Alteromonas sediminis]